jgi:peptide/nickel transport system substrate-binding protein
LDITDESSAVDDRTVQFRLKKRFPLLPAALGKSGTNMPCIMPERLARADPYTQITEMVGSGPYRFKPRERVPGALTVYERFDNYVPRPDGPATFTAGPKRARFDRVEWRVISDTSTAANALAIGEVDWWENPTPDLQALLRSKPGIKVEVSTIGGLGCLRFNQLFPPFDNPAIRRALLGAVDQAEVMTAVAGDERDLWKDHVGVFTPGTPWPRRKAPAPSWASATSPK